jgi:hypothetical protein
LALALLAQWDWLLLGSEIILMRLRLFMFMGMYMVQRQAVSGITELWNAFMAHGTRIFHSDVNID